MREKGYIVKNAKKTVNVKRAEALFAKIKKEGPVENPDFTVEGMLLLLQDPVLSLYDSHQAALSLWFGVGKPYLDTEKGGRNDFFTSSEIAAFLQQNDLSYSFSSNYKNGIKSFISFLRHHPQQPLCSTAVLQKRQAEKDAKKLATKKEMSQAFLASLPHVLARLQEQVKEALDCLGITSQQAERQSLLVSSLAFTPIHELELTVRSLNVLKSMNINYLGELVTYSEGDLLKVPNCGRKSINEIREVLASRGIALRAVPGVSR